MRTIAVFAYFIVRDLLLLCGLYLLLQFLVVQLVLAIIVAFLVFVLLTYRVGDLWVQACNVRKYGWGGPQFDVTHCRIRCAEDLPPRVRCDDNDA